MSHRAPMEALVAAARRAHRDAVTGNLSDIGASLRALESTSHVVTRAWAAALRTELWLIEPRYGWRPPAEWLADFVDGPALAREGAAIALANGARAAVIDFDGTALTALAELAPKLTAGLAPSAELVATLVGAWAALAAGDSTTARERATELAQRASKHELSALLVEAQALRALASTALGDHAAALDLARRASLMARTEGLPQPEFIAHLALARARRHARQPHLAFRILEALAAVAPDAWQAWLAWESVFATGTPREPSAGMRASSANAARAVDALGQVLTSARAGDGAACARSSHDLLQATARFSPVRTEAMNALAAIDPGRPAPSAELDDWRHGRNGLLPAALDGLRARSGDDEESASAYVSIEVGRAGVRLLHAGVSLQHAPGVVRLRQSQRAQGRVETLLAILGLAGPAGIDEPSCFAQTYGFELVPELHRGVFDVLLHRARAALGEYGRLERGEHGLALRALRPLLVPDPRVSQRATDRVLRLLAERGSASAKDAAALLGISLRSAQAALADLTTAGACEARKDGRNVAYVVEDTIFSEPSRKLCASDLTGLTSLQQYEQQSP